MMKYLIAALALLILNPTVSLANEAPKSDPETSKDWEISVGAGALFSPNYLGDDAYNLSTVPYIRVTYSDRFFASVQEGVGYNLVTNANFRAGPLIRLEFGRDEDGSGTFRVAGNRTNDLRGMGDIDTSVLLGGFAEIDLGDFTTSAKLGQAVSGHDGLTGDIGVSYKGIVRGNGPPIIYSLGPRINFGDDQYMTSLFGVNASQSQASGLAVFAASGGVVSYGVSGTAIMPLTDAISLTLISSYNRLAGDAGDSSLVTDRGSRDQAFLGLVMSYKLR